MSHAHPHHHHGDHTHADGDGLMHTLHGHHHQYHGASRRALLTAFLLTGLHLIVVVVGSYLSGSLSLAAHAGHMLTDMLGLGVALAALHFSVLPASAERTFGLRRLEVLSAMLNALFLWLIAGGLVMALLRRLEHGHDHSVEGEIMLVVGIVGLFIHLAAVYVLQRSMRLSINVEGAFRHMLVHAVESIAVLISGFLVWRFGFHLADWVLAVLLVVTIVISTWPLISKVVGVLLQGVPPEIDVYRLCSEMEDVPGVTLVHDIHVWALVPQYNVLTAHVLVDPESGTEQLTAIRDQLRAVVLGEFPIHHSTIQLEFSAADCGEENHHVDHLLAMNRDEWKKARL